MTGTLNKVSDETWDGALAAFPRATAFHASRWLRATVPALGYDLSLCALVDRGGAVAGLVPLAVRRRGPFRLLGHLPYPYVGPLAHGDRMPDLLRAFRRRTVIASRIEFPPGADVDPVALAVGGYNVIDDETLVIHVAGRSEDDLWAALHPNCRTAIRRTHKAGVEVVDADAEMVCELMPRMQREVFRRNGAKPPYDETVFRAVWEAYGGTDEARFCAAVRGSEVLGVQAMIVRDGTIYGWQSATFPEKGVTPSAIMYWADLRWAVGRGLERYDLVGTPTPGIARFKRQFGAVPERYTVASTESPAYRGVAAVRALIPGRRAPAPEQPATRRRTTPGRGGEPALTRAAGAAPVRASHASPES